MSAVTRGWIFSVHALGAMRERGLGREQVVRACLEPDAVYGPQSGRDPRVRVYQRGEVAVVVNPERRTILTVLSHVNEEWGSRVDA